MTSQSMNVFKMCSNINYEQSIYRNINHLHWFNYKRYRYEKNSFIQIIACDSWKKLHKILHNGLRDNVLFCVFRDVFVLAFFVMVL